MHYLIQVLLTLALLFPAGAQSAGQCRSLFETHSFGVGSLEWVLNQFEFPESAQRKTTNHRLRLAIYEAFEGKDFFTGERLLFDDMSIDHVLPQSLGGPNNVYNYVPTLRRVNNAKGAKFDSIAAVGILSIVRIVYAPKVIEIMERLESQPELDAPKRDGSNKDEGSIINSNFQLIEQHMSLVSRPNQLIHLTRILRKLLEKQPDLLQVSDKGILNLVITDPRIISQLPPPHSIREALRESQVNYWATGVGGHVQESGTAHLIYGFTGREFAKNPAQNQFRISISKEYLDLLREDAETIEEAFKTRTLFHRASEPPQ